ncbi:Thiamine pyrophosphokinase 3 [Galdieria sulphuraria]|nr:Thiamine pyrophosphokinase 3 [Galdieria sulphuraria]
MNQSLFCISKLLQGLPRSLSLLLLNGESFSASLVSRLWQSAAFTVCADGGSNRLFDCFGTDQRDRFVPNVIKGDFDSIRPEVIKYYASKKCLGSIEPNIEDLPTVVLGGIGGRMDQQLANIHILHKFLPRKIYLLSLDQVMWLLPGGKHCIVCSKDIEGPLCGLIPIGSICREATTTGLRWNLDHQPLSFGSFISSSNEIVDSFVEIETSDTLLWWSELKLRNIL